MKEQQENRNFAVMKGCIGTSQEMVDVIGSGLVCLEFRGYGALEFRVGGLGLGVEGFLIFGSFGHKTWSLGFRAWV